MSAFHNQINKWEYVYRALLCHTSKVGKIKVQPISFRLKLGYILT